MAYLTRYMGAKALDDPEDFAQVFPILEFTMVFNLVPHVLAPLTALVYASGMIQDEVEGQTLIYLLLHPQPRWALYLTRWLATLLTATLVTVVGTTAVYIAIYAGTPMLWDDVPDRTWKTAAALALAQISYCGIFGGLGLLRRSLVIGVLYIAIFEGLVANVDFVARGLTVAYYFRALVLRWLNLPDLLRLEWEKAWQLDLATAPGVGDCVRTLLLVGLVLALLSARWFTSHEFRMKTSEDA